MLMSERQNPKQRVYCLISRLVWHGLAVPVKLYCRLLPCRSGGSTSCCALLHTFDGYKRFWPAALFFSDSALPSGLSLICVSEMIPMDHLGTRYLLTGSGSFVWRLLRAVHQLRRTYRFVLYLQEDMWLPNPVPQSSLESWLALMYKHQLHLLKLSAESMPRNVPPLLANQPSLDHTGSLRITWYGCQDFALSHHVSLFDADFLLKTLLFAWIMGARKPKEHEIYVSKALRSLLTSWEHPDRPVRIAAWQQQPLIEMVHASDGGELTPAAIALLAEHPDAPVVDESLPGEVFPARQSSRRGRHALG